MINSISLKLSFKACLKQYIEKNNLFKKGPNTRYDLDDILDVIEYILITGASWRSLNLPVFTGKYKWQSIYTHFNRLCKANVFKLVYLDLLSTYLKTNKSGKLKYLSIDTSFIKNEYASDCNFGWNKKKKCSKLSLITDSNGVPLSALLIKGSISDQKAVFDNFDDMFVDITQTNIKSADINQTNIKSADINQTNIESADINQTNIKTDISRTDINQTNINNKINNKHKRYFLADSGYDNKEIRNYVKNINVTAIIVPNKKNTKDREKLKTKKLTKKEKKIYAKRIIIENCFSWLFKNSRVSKRYDKLPLLYFGFLFMAFIKLILKRL
jgi:transposase